jgi:hypothetical protein
LDKDYANKSNELLWCIFKSIKAEIDDKHNEVDKHATFRTMLINGALLHVATKTRCGKVSLKLIEKICNTIIDEIGVTMVLKHNTRACLKDMMQFANNSIVSSLKLWFEGCIQNGWKMVKDATEIECHPALSTLILPFVLMGFVVCTISLMCVTIGSKFAKVACSSDSSNRDFIYRSVKFRRSKSTSQKQHQVRPNTPQLVRIASEAAASDLNNRQSLASYRIVDVSI